jgi:ribosomal protein S9
MRSNQNTMETFGRRHYGTADYWLTRLERDGFTDLAAKVRSGELSAHAAAIKVGFRKKLSALEQILRLLPKLSDEDRSTVQKELDQLRPTSPFKTSSL